MLDRRFPVDRCTRSAASLAPSLARAPGRPRGKTDMPSFKSHLFAFVLKHTRKKSFASVAGMHARLKAARATEDFRPPHKIAQRMDIAERAVDGMTVYEVRPKTGATGPRVVYLHGGAYLFEITAHHWKLIAEIAERLSAADPASADRASNTSVSLSKIGDVLLSQDDRDGALTHYQRSLEIAERLSAADPASADRASDTSVSLSKVGDVLLSQGDREGALAHYQRSLEIAERRFAAGPGSVELARGLSVLFTRMAFVTEDRRYLERSLAILRDLEARGALADSDRRFIARLEEILAGLGPPPD